MTQRAARLDEMRKAAETQAAKIKENKWVLPLEHYAITATFGQYGLWASYHTGLDFNGETGDPIIAIANGTVTSTGYDGAYGNKTVVTLDDGTEIWYCHQTSIYVSVGDRVNGGEIIGTVGATGNVTGSHLHLEVRPGGGGPSTRSGLRRARVVPDVRASRHRSSPTASFRRSTPGARACRPGRSAAAGA